MESKTDDTSPLVHAIAHLIAQHNAAGVQVDVEEAAREWLEQGFDDPEEVASWLAAGCAEAVEARRLEDAGITPEQAALRTSAGTSGTEDTLARKLARGELSLAEARRLITRGFWDD